MSKHWNGTGKASTATGHWRLLSSAALLICLIITGCKNREERAPTDKVPIMENNNDLFDDYQDDPEDELRFDPEIFDFQDD